MQEFHNVTVVKKPNIYFEGKVASTTVLFADGSKKTLGVMQVGEYTFGTELAEIMEMTSGEVAVKLAGEGAFTTYVAPATFEVPSNSKFDIHVKSVSSYCCSYIQ